MTAIVLLALSVILVVAVCAAAVVVLVRADDPRGSFGYEPPRSRLSVTAK